MTTDPALRAHELRDRVIREITVAPGWNKEDATALVDELILSLPYIDERALAQAAPPPAIPDDETCSLCGRVPPDQHGVACPVAQAAPPSGLDGTGSTDPALRALDEAWEALRIEGVIPDTMLAHHRRAIEAAGLHAALADMRLPGTETAVARELRETSRIYAYPEQDPDTETAGEAG
jgi:hypothetical protein